MALPRSAGGFTPRAFLMAAPALLSLKDLTLRFGNQEVLAGATLAVGEGEKVGLVGRNGCGKSSLLRIIAGEEQADGGIVSRSQGLVTGYLPQEFRLEDEATVEDNVRSGASGVLDLVAQYEAGKVHAGEEAALLAHIEHLGGWDVDSRVKTAMTELFCPPPDRLVRDLSGGEKRRVALARAIVSQPDLLLLDEPTNHLDADSIRWLEEYLRASKSGCLFVTHDRYFLDRIATRIAELDGGRIWVHEGNYSDYLVARAERQAADAAREDRRQTFLRREIEWVRAGVKARTTKAQSRLNEYHRIAGQEAPPEEREMELIIPPASPLGNVIVDAEGLSASGGERRLFSGLDLKFEPGTCTGVVGRNGAGKSTLLRVLMAQQPPDAGRVTIGRNVVFNYVDQQRLALDGSKSLIEEIGGKSDFIQWGAEKLHIRTYLRRFLFSDDRPGQRVEVLSGGERSRLLLAKILCRGGNFIVLDEPTNDLDLPTLRVLEEAILGFPGCVLVVSHDRWFLDRICDRVVVFESNGNVHVQEGNYSYYLEKNQSRLAAERAALTAAARAAAPAKVAPPKAKPRKLTWKEERELEGMEAAIMAVEEEAAAIDAQLHDPSFYITRAAEAAGLTAQIEAKKAQAVALYARWEELESIASAG